MKRRNFLKGAATTGVAGAAAMASTFPAPALSKGRMEWRMVTAWPKNFPGLGNGANLLADYITKASNGRLTIKVYGGGEIVPPFEAIDAVANGTAEMGHGTPHYWKGKEPATQFLSSVPFGMNTQEKNAWLLYGGGQALADEAYKKMGCKFFPSGSLGVQMGGWFNKEITSLEDYKGLKIRIPGFGGEVVKAAGGNVVNLPGGEVLPALQSGAIDAAEFSSPYPDLAFGLYQSAKFYYFPGWQEPDSILDNFINLEKWDALPDDLKTIIEIANRAVNHTMLCEFTARNSASLDALVNKHGVLLKRFPDDVLVGLSDLADQVINDIAAKDPLSTKVMNSYRTFQNSAAAWDGIFELPRRGAQTWRSKKAGG